MATREELLKAAKRKMLLQKAKEKMALSQSVPQEAIVEGPQANQTAGGFLGAQMPGEKVPVMDGLSNAVKLAAEAARNVPVIGDAVTAGAKGLTEMIGIEEPGAYEARREEALTEMPEAMELAQGVGKVGGSMALPGIALPAAANVIDTAIDTQDVGATGEAAAMEGLFATLPAGLKVGGKLLNKTDAVQNIRKALSGMAEKNALEALAPTSAQLGDLIKSGDRNRLGRKLMDEDLLKGDKEAILKRLMTKKDKLIKTLGDEVTTISDQVPDIDRNVLSNKLKNLGKTRANEVLDDDIARYYDKAGKEFLTKEMKQAKSTANRMKKEADKWRYDPEKQATLLNNAAQLDNKVKEVSSISFEELVDIRKSLDDKATTAFKSNSPQGAKLRNVANKMREIEDDIAMGISPDYKVAKSLTSDVIELEKMATSAAGKAERNALGSISQTLNRSIPTIIGSTVGAASGGTAGGIIGAAIGNRGGKVWEMYGPQLKAAGFDSMSKLGNDSKFLRGLVEALEKGGPAAVRSYRFKETLENEKYRKKHGKGE